MTPNNSNQAPQADAQGSFFAEHIVRSGSTEPGHLAVRSQLELSPDGTYPGLAVTPTIEDEDTTLDAAVHEAVKTDHRRTGQVGKHSSIERAGSYSGGLTVGDFLPGFGPVTYSNFNAAQERARTLDAKRTQR